MTTFLPVNFNNTGAEIKMDFQKSSTAPFMPQTERSVKREAREQGHPLYIPANHGENKRQAVDGAATDHPKPNYSHPNPGVSHRSGSREGSSTQSSAPEDVAAHDSEGEHYASENEAEAGDAAPPSKKKKGQRFYCKDFPPCNLSFTRSEHLARHIRKHTGERPFQCHCSRRFSRLDNLRQHAQTVHVNEDIPGDSLAATGTRFQRQIRTDRVRPPGRARAGTGGSQTGGPNRGHSRNLSTSSIASTVSSFSQTQELRRRPPPIIMAGDGAARARLSLETASSPPKTPPQQIHPYSVQSPSTALFTPSSATYDTTSPFYASPASATGFWGDSIHARRLSVPSGSRPFDASHASSYPPAHLRQLAPASGPYAGNESPLGGPTGPHTPQSAQGMSPSDSDWRRRTWHPSSGFARPVSSGLWIQQSADQPSSFPPNLQSVPDQPPPRLPGIESFDQIRQNPSAPPRREPTPMQIDHPALSDQSSTQQTPTAPVFPTSFNPHPPLSRPPPPISGPGHRRGYLSLDMSLHRNLTKLDIREKPSQNDASQWGKQTTTVQQEPLSAESVVSGVTTQALPTITSSESHTVLGPTNLDGQNKRHAWYSVTGSNPPQRNPSITNAPPDANAQAPSASSVDYLATVAQNESEIERRHSLGVADGSGTSSQPPKYTFDPNSEPRSGVYSGPAGNENGLDRLEALVAVATSQRR
ncbi:predicted protein [Uncinocarpus reesii 1704]|uniref:C2H2-type domain-containing protein n=1 Tax=Uncinocarpus reesii (strain UAMH 1704) TaxID=336963 RepID=C4JWC3_UNCRE|nr:uncharacterized protein UREG_06865 [Uncinocarpus reesii 1704]EEP82000.1 predicted protein [Uncinocarpus reesii 1704]